MLQKRFVSALCALAVSVSVSMMCAVNTSAATQSPLVAELMRYNPNMTSAQIQEQAQEIADEYGISAEEVMQIQLDEVRAATQPVAEVSDGKLLGGVENQVMSSSSGGEGAKVVLPNASYKGDIFWTPARTAGIAHGHVGIYTDSKTIVEAVGTGQVSRMVEAKNVRVAEGSKLMYVNTTQATRNQAAQYSTQMVGKPYNNNFFYNHKVDDDSYNCSQLVWAAYKKTGLDLDSDGGWGVYPNDILNSNKTVTYRTL